MAIRLKDTPSSIGQINLTLQSVIVPTLEGTFVPAPGRQGAIAVALGDLSSSMIGQSLTSSFYAGEISVWMDGIDANLDGTVSNINPPTWLSFGSDQPVFTQSATPENPEYWSFADYYVPTWDATFELVPPRPGVTVDSVNRRLVYDGSGTEGPTTGHTLSASQAPAYIAALAPFDVLPLSVVANGNPTWMDAVDPIYDTTSFDGGNDNAVYSVRRINVESGGFADPDNRVFYALGGGHADGAYNGILKFDLNGTTQPVGWSVVPGSESAVSDIPQVAAGEVAQNFGTYPDGKAGSTHNYGAMVYDSQTQTMFRFMGSYWSLGTTAGIPLTEINKKFDFTTGTWGNIPWFNSVNQGAAVVHGVVAHDKASRKALYINGFPGSGWGNFFNLATQTFTTKVNIPSTATSWTPRLQAGYDPTRGRIIVVGRGRQKMMDVDFAGESIANLTDFTATGDTEILGPIREESTYGIEGIGVEYDPVLDRFWLFGGRPSDGSAVFYQYLPFTKIYWIEAADFDDGAVTVYSQTLSQEIPYRTEAAGLFHGMYRRYCLIPEWRALALATTYEHPVHIIRLPA